MGLLDAAVLFLAAIGGGALNSVAGGGSFLTFPTLLFTGVPAIQANATNTVALWPGSVVAASAYRRDVSVERGRLVALSIVSLFGGYAGAWLLLNTPESTFRGMIPWLLLLATAVFAFGSPLVAQLRAKMHHPVGERHFGTLGLLAQFPIAVYGGYFGGGIGILMLAALTLVGMENIHSMNGLKNWLAACINGVAVVTFIIAGAVWWSQALVMVAGAIIGGYGGASLARKVDPRKVRRFVIAVGVGLTVYFFVHG
jgi:hypothetical protein